MLMFNKLFVSRKYYDGSCKAYEDCIEQLGKEICKYEELEQKMKSINKSVMLNAAHIKSCCAEINDYYDNIVRIINEK